MPNACQLCLSSDFETVSDADRHGQPLRTVLCRGCGSITNDPIPDEAELAEFYRSQYRVEYKGAAEPRMRQIWRNFSRVRDHMRDNRQFYSDRRSCLDLGSGSGEFMFLAREIGIDCIGIEPNTAYANYSREKLGLNILVQAIEDTSFPAGKFDLIRLSHVLEHMSDPVRSLATLRNWLADDGLLYIEVPNIRAEAAQKMRGKLFHYGHIFNFSPPTLRAAAALAGLELHPDSRRRHADMTLGFFMKGRAITHAQAANPENARVMAEAMRSHRARLLPAPEKQSALTRGIASVTSRLSEILQSRRYPSPGAIADSFASLVRSDFAK
jgi:SAM-dependent methyltransferase